MTQKSFSISRVSAPLQFRWKHRYYYYYYYYAGLGDLAKPGVAPLTKPIKVTEFMSQAFAHSTKLLASILIK
mgnify:CR=1